MGKLFDIIRDLFYTNYDKCHYEMEKKGEAGFIFCNGLIDGGKSTDYSNNGCVGCPYLVSKKR